MSVSRVRDLTDPAISHVRRVESHERRAEALPGIAEQEAYLAEWDAILKRDEAALIERRAEYEWCRRGVEALKAARQRTEPPSRELYEDAP